MNDGAPATAGLVELSLEEEWPRLRAQLELRDTTWLCFVFCSSPEQARELLARARSQLRAAGRGLMAVSATEPQSVVMLVDALMRTTAGADLTWVDGVATRVNRLDAGALWEQTLLRANDHRDALLRRHGDGLVFCLPSELKPVLRETAPDLWAKRVLAMEVDPPLKLLPVPEGRVIDVPAHQPERIVVAPPLDAKAATRNRVLGEELGRARSLRAAGNEVEAVRLLERALAGSVPANERAQALTELAAAREAQHDIPGAIRALEEALSTGGLTRRQLERAIDRLEDLAEREGRPELAAAAAGAQVSLRRGAEPSSRADALQQLSRRLTEVGRHEDALAAGEESVALYRSQAETRPEAIIPDLARSLSNLSVPLSKLGRHEDALAASEESVAQYRSLADSRPDDLAWALNNLSNCLSILGRYEDAVAVAEESVALYRALAVGRPDLFSADLARSLNDLSNRLSALGRREDALTAIEESAKLYRPLAAAAPNAFLPALALSLNNLSIAMSDVGRSEDALTANDESIAAYRALAEARPDAFLAELAMSLNNRANRLSHVGRSEDALAAIEESVALYRPLAEARPDAFGADLGDALTNLSNSLSNIGRSEDALAAIEESLPLRRAAAEARPDASLPDLAMALHNLSLRLAELGRPQEAFERAEEAVGVVLPALERAPYLLPDGGVRLARRYADAAEAAGQVVDDELWRRLQAVTRRASPS